MSEIVVGPRPMAYVLTKCEPYHRHPPSSVFATLEGAKAASGAADEWEPWEPLAVTGAARWRADNLPNRFYWWEITEFPLLP